MAGSLFVRLNVGTCPHLMRLALSKSRNVNSTLRLCLVSYEGSHHAGSDFPSPRCFSTSPPPKQESKPISSPLSQESKPSLTSATNLAGEFVNPEDLEPREQYIPLSRLSMIRCLMEEKDLLLDSEKEIFIDFARSLDQAIMTQYQGILGELKNLFDPINPDKDTIQTREFSRREKLDNEFWLLKQLSDVMRQANFYEIPKAKVEKLLQEHSTYEGVTVSVDWSRYDVLRFWVLGHESPKASLSITERITNTILRRVPREATKYYKRVVVAIRLKKDSKLILKAFKEVPAQGLEMLLPDGTVKMSALDKGVLITSVSIAAFGILAKMVTYLASYHMDWMLLLTSVTGLIAFRAWSMYTNRRNHYLIKVTQTLYYKNVANNRSLIALLVDRAGDETFKEALLAYVFLMTSKPAAVRDFSKALASSQFQGGLTQEDLKERVEAWVEKRTGFNLLFDCTDSLALLKNLGLLTETDDKLLRVVRLEVASKMLPPVVGPKGLQGEEDVMDGFDRNPYLETEEEYKDNERKSSKYGWF